MRWPRTLLLALSCLPALGSAASAADPQIWFNPHGTSDMMDMWTDDAPWPNAAKKVDVLEIVHWWLDTVTDQQVLEITNFAKQHHMKIDLEIEAVTRFPNQCGLGDEGYTAPGDLARQAGMLKRLGVKVDIMTMDEPMWFGHYASDPAACQLPVADLAANVAANMSAITALYPDIQLYEIEPIPAVTNFPTWRQDLAAFQIGLSQGLGKSVRGVQLDVGWETPAWQPAMQGMNSFVHQNNMTLGIFEYATFDVRSNTEWINSAVQHIEYVEGTLGIVPEMAIFTTWSPYPQTSMPETSPTTLTWLINRYFRQRTVMTAQFVGAGAHGQLMDDAGQPIANATINAYVPGVDFSQPLPTRALQDVVPPNAAYGLIGYRLNVECNCAGYNDVLVGLLQYQEIQGGTRSYSYIFPFFPQNYSGVMVDAEWVGGVQVNRVIATPTQQLAANSAWFPVTPNATFTFTVPASTIGGEGWFGHAMVLWADANMNGITTNDYLVPDAGKRLMSSTTTAADGTFALPVVWRVGPGSAPITIEFAGDGTHRSVAWSPLP